MKLTVITPSVRPEGLEIIKKCLDRQTFKDFEWIVVSPFEYKDAIWVQDPPKREGDFYRLNGAWNAALKRAKGELFVSIVDMIWFPPDTLEKLWGHYVANPRRCVTCVGHQYEKLVNGKPEGLVWREPRVRPDFKSFYEVAPSEMELCVASLPMKAVKEVGGLDEEYDKHAALSEKEMCYRIDKLGYTFWIEQSIEYRALYHPRLSEAWDKHYESGCILYQKHRQEIAEGKRLKVGYLE